MNFKGIFLLRFLFSSLFLVCCCSNYHSQNLVPNPGFEDQSPCEGWSSLLSNGSAEPWNCPSIASSDLYNFDCTESGLINNGIGSAGIITYHEPEYREYLQVPLTQTLTQGKKHCIQLYAANLFDGFDSFGIYFSDTMVTYSQHTVLDQFTPQLELDAGEIIEGQDFQLLEWEYFPTGSENYMLVGNFNTDENTTTSNGDFEPINYSYCYLDDFVIEECAIEIGVSEMKEINPITIFPNPNNGEFEIVLPIGMNGKLYIYDSQGRKVHSEIVNSMTNIEVYLYGLNSGIYQLVLFSEGIYASKKLVIE